LILLEAAMIWTRRREWR